jgi:phospholipid/cholesterol/gamma-HCH transport system permease protein
VQPEPNFTEKTEGALLISLSGDWKVGNALPSADDIGKQIEAGLRVQRVTFDGRGIASWDSTLLTFLIRIRNLCS